MYSQTEFPSNEESTTFESRSDVFDRTVFKVIGEFSQVSTSHKTDEADFKKSKSGDFLENSNYSFKKGEP